MILLFIELLKPKIIFGNLISSLGGFLLASKGSINYKLLFLNMISVSLVIGSSCIFNNIIDSDIDKYMSRTKNRILVTNTCFYNLSIFFGIFLGILGFLIYGYFVNVLCMLLSFLGFIIYVVCYSLFLKRKSIYSTLVGSISGAIPPILGYCSVTNYIDLCVLNLFLIFFVWQIPHSYAIFIMHFNDYKKANIPIFPSFRSFSETKIHVNIFIFLFLTFSCLLTVMKYVGHKFFICIFFLSMIWIFLSEKKYKNDYDHVLWAKNIFYHSILLIFVTNIMMALDYIN
ncbi:hypothetical protein XW81_02130 [Buchnera aphidicola (Schlechtendalia chinensis)]|uniref:Protoheme IX farnesyltransferase n=1 Tax=Buchnera aphidicola subsp. Schlechtendalia chinensis TaxID=118110 RepID=A0A172WDX0_BUCSC|nr:heme o synthase [Buchnera aphidicola]ANF17179.1 hypothetical protein XW81_02130 [Buchnera aphidicola (Schlechtendalia chinensis)]